MKKVEKVHKRNPQDATLRNIRALKQRLTTLEEIVQALKLSHEALQEVVANIKW